MLDAKDIELLRGMFSEQKQDILGETTKMLAKQKQDILGETTKMLAEQKQDILGETTKMLAEQKRDILEESAANMRVMIESYFQPQFNLLAESIKSIEEKMIPRSEIEELHNEIDFLKMVVRSLSQDVAELKKAQ